MPPESVTIRCARHLSDEPWITERLHQSHALVRKPQPLDGRAHLGIVMHRNGEFDVVEFLDQRDDGAADRLHALALQG
jgi:hypothetical protein